MKKLVNTTEDCHWLHNILEELPMIRYPFDTNILPMNGIYFFYQEGEFCGHESNAPKIVRIGTHKEGNFRNRISEHFLFNDSKMNFNEMKRKPSDRSIFRKNIGRALLNKDNDDYLDIWNKRPSNMEGREKYYKSRDVEKEKDIETLITKILRQQFTFRFIIVDTKTEWMGSKGLESSLIGTVSHCELCKPSKDWLGCFSPKKQIKNSGLWLIQHLGSEGINNQDKENISINIKKTKEWIAKCK